MQIVAITTDKILIGYLQSIAGESPCDLQIYEKFLDPLDVMSYVCSTTPPVLLIDDDCLKPNTAHILRSIKKVSKQIKVIFFTSDDSLELGREISPIGIHYYGIKPVEEDTLNNLLNSIKKQISLNNNSFN